MNTMKLATWDSAAELTQRLIADAMRLTHCLEGSEGEDTLGERAGEVRAILTRAADSADADCGCCRRDANDARRVIASPVCGPTMADAHNAIARVLRDCADAIARLG